MSDLLTLASTIVEQLKKQGIKATITAAKDPLNDGSTYRVEWRGVPWLRDTILLCA